MPALNWTEEVDAGKWVLENLHVFGTDVGSLVPTTFDSYVRILHPASDGYERGWRVRWADLSEKMGLTLGPSTQFSELDAGESIEAPARGRMSPDDLAELVAILEPHTETPDDCWFGVWGGYAWMTGGTAAAWLDPTLETSVPSVDDDELPTNRLTSTYRSYALYRGSVEAARALGSVMGGQSPNLWWPKDRAWCVASEIDLDSTFIGGSGQLIESIVKSERLEAMRVSVADRISGEQTSGSS